MSVQYCHGCGERYDTDFNVDCPRCPPMTSPTIEQAPTDMDQAKGWLPIVLCPTDGVDRTLLLPDGRETVGAFSPVGRPTRWRVVVEYMLRPAHKLDPIGGVERWSAPYVTKVYSDLPEGIYPTHFRPNDTAWGAPNYAR